MSISPIIHSVLVRGEPARAFELFTSRIGDWWPRGKAIGREPFVDIRLEPVVGGRWYERDAHGHETDWGRVLAWEPPHRLLLAWQIGADFTFQPQLITEVELSFDADGAGTRVTLEHRNIERLGADAARCRGLLDGGWPGVMRDFQDFAIRPLK